MCFLLFAALVTGKHVGPSIEHARCLPLSARCRAPPGHGDIYPSLLGSGMLDRLLADGIK